MNEQPEHVPEYMPTSLAVPNTRLEELALELYQQLAAETARARECERQCREQLDALSRDANRTIRELAAERFEFGRLVERILPALTQAGLADVIKVLDIYARTWDANLKRARVEVENLTGRVLTDELAELVEVESAIPDPAVRETIVRKTLTPLVKIDGRVTGLAKVNTSVPAGPHDEDV